MPIVHAMGIDPGLVHTGCVRIVLDPNTRSIDVQHLVVQGLDCDEVVNWTGIHRWKDHPCTVFIEKYEPRRKYDSDERMVKGEAELKRRLPHAVLLSNTDVKWVVTAELMRALGVWTFPATHHQDLRSAARIALLGLLRDPGTNMVVADAVAARLDGRPWT